MKSKFLPVLLILLFAKCKKDPEYHPVGDEMVELLGFQTGSYWIMKDSTTLALDSLVCTNVGSDYHGDRFRYQRRYYIIYENFKDIEGYDGIWRIEMYAEKARDMCELFFSKSTAIQGIRYYPFISIPIQSKSTIGGTEVSVTFISSLVINGRNFSDVYHVQYTNKGNSTEEHFYISKEVGLIKIVQDNDQTKRTLLLERWNIKH